ncbi:MAG: NAD-binding protein [Dehalococcoidia bacterium]|nr:NAD-binding protein [Dehalococcoidia bacterium]
MTSIAFCGVGQMGSPMARRLIEAGHEVAVWNRTREKAAELASRGARLADSPADAALGAAVVITMLSTSEALEAVTFGEGGIAAGIGSAATLIEMSTVGPSAVHDTASRLAAGVALLDAPVFGSVPEAVNGTLRIFVGGEPKAFQRWRGLLEVLGQPTYYGALGSGAAMKIVVNSTLAGQIAVLGEAMALADALGLGQSEVLDVLIASPIGPTVDRKRGFFESDAYPASFKLGLAAKDVRLVAESARAAGVELRLAEATAQWLSEADRAGLSDLDYSAVVAYIRGRPAHEPKAAAGDTSPQ